VFKQVTIKTENMNMIGMPPKLRTLYLAVWNGLNPPHAVTTKLHYLDAFFPRTKLEAALKYLIKNQLTGAKFVEWYADTCSGSDLEMHRELMKQVERTRIRRALTAAKDLRT
jgi:hypothetical protein